MAPYVIFMMPRRIFVAILFLVSAGCARQTPSPPKTRDINAQVHKFCGACHAYPPPETFPRWAWKEEVERGYLFFTQSSLALTAPPIDDVVKYYEDRAPEKLPTLRPELSKNP